MESAVNHILFLYWNHQISRKQTLEYLADIPSGEIHERILEAAKRFCFKGSIKNWTAGMTMKARDEGLIEDYEYWTAERIANDMAEKARTGKRKLY